MARAIGIDLGTTNSAAAVMEGGAPLVLESAEGARTTPSVVAVNPRNGERYVGLPAKRQAAVNPANTVHSVKRLMGCAWSEAETEAAALAYAAKRGPRGSVAITLAERDYSPQEISAMVLRKLKADAEEKLGEPVDAAVVTVPAYFNDSQRKATRDAGRIAGLEVRQVLNEPTAAALAYGLDREDDGVVAVFDLGGGTFDVSILRISDGVFEVAATSGDARLGGDDFDRRIVDWLAAQFEREHGVDPRGDAQAYQRLREAAERAKVELSAMLETEVNLPFLIPSAGESLHLAATLTRTQLVRLTGNLVERIDAPCRQAMADAGVGPADITEVVLAGGMTRMPAVAQKAAELFGRQPHKGVNPDEVVAIGAAIQAGVVSGEVDGVELLDVTPLSLGVEVHGGRTSVLIPRNTSIPASITHSYTTTRDGQTEIHTRVLQGEREMAADNKAIGDIRLGGIAPAQRGTPDIEVTFSIDVNGILTVAAEDTVSGARRRVAISSSTDLTQQEVRRLVAEAREHAAEDQLRREAVEARNLLDGVILDAEQALCRFGERISMATRVEVEAAATAARAILEHEESDADSYASAAAALSGTLLAIGRDIYPPLFPDDEDEEEYEEDDDDEEDEDEDD